MSESVNIENKKQSRQKPPLSAGRIACEILAGVLAGFAVPVPLAYAVGYVMLYVIYGAPPDDKNLGLAGFLVFGAMAFSFLILYGPATAIGIYLVGTRGNQTGSFWVTVGGLFLGVPVIVLLFLYSDMAESKGLEVVKIILWSLIFLTPPIIATIGLNVRRRYKEPPLS